MSDCQASCPSIFHEQLTPRLAAAIHTWNNFGRLAFGVDDEEVVNADDELTDDENDAIADTTVSNKHSR